jgi:LPXTG-site transpeptidase (sortase) family protein
MPKKPKKIAVQTKSANKKKKPTSLKLKKSEVILTSKQPGFKHFLLTGTLLLLGINLFVAGTLYLLYKKTVLSFTVSPVVTADAHLRRDLPTRISIDSAHINLAIQEATIENGIWETSNTHATHLDASLRPGEGGNIVIYGHNLKRIFGPLHVVKKGDKINIQTADNKLYEYTVQNIETVSPSAIEKVLPTDHEVLTIYTCTGLLDSQRLVITAFPSRVATLQ